MNTEEIIIELQKIKLNKKEREIVKIACERLENLQYKITLILNKKIWN